jgi:putative two-component system response regulator
MEELNPTKRERDITHLLGLKILIVDDEVQNLAIVKEILDLSGFEQIFLYTSPSLALKFFAEHEVDIVLLDLRMPEMTGPQLASEFERVRPGHKIPILVLTAVSDKKVRDFMLSLGGAHDFLIKPFDDQDLLNRTCNLLETRLTHKQLTDMVEKRTSQIQLAIRHLKDSRQAIIQTLGRAGEYRDEETGAHTLRMGAMSAILAQAIGWDSQQVEQLRLAAPVHDIGKIGIPDGILLKKGKLADHERLIMQEHVEIGRSILLGSLISRQSALLQAAAEIAYGHHEKWDGVGGYPRGIKGEEIPLAARIVAVADTFDALLSRRPYKEPWEPKVAINYIIESSGKQFDPRIVAAFRSCSTQLLQVQSSMADGSRANFWSKVIELAPDENTASA